MWNAIWETIIELFWGICILVGFGIYFKWIAIMVASGVAEGWAKVKHEVYTNIVIKNG